MRFSFKNSVECSVSLRSASFIAAFRKIIILSLCFLFSAYQAFALSYEDGEIRTTAREVARLQELLKGTPYEVSPELFRQRELKFVDGQLNHILRVVDGTQRALHDPRFQREFPRESKILLAFLEQTVRQSLTHDLGKFLKETAEANRGLILAQELNYRQLLAGIDPFLTPKQAREVGHLIKHFFIHDVNVGEARAVNGSFQELMPNHSEFKRAHELLTAVYDWYDSAVNRTDLGADRKNTYDWVKQLQQEGAFDDTSKTDVKFMMKAARYVDGVDLLRQSHYKKVVLTNLKIGPFNTVAEYQMAFEARSKHLIERAKRSKARIKSCRDLWR